MNARTENRHFLIRFKDRLWRYFAYRITSSTRLLEFFGSLRWRWLAMRILCASFDTQKLSRDRRTILVFNRKSTPRQDITQLRKNSKHHWITIEVAIISRFLKYLAPIAMQRQILHNCYRGGKYDQGRQAVADFAEEFLEFVRHRYNLDAVMSLNIDYWQDVGFHVACQNLDIPFLVLHREVQTRKNDIDWYKSLLRRADFHFPGNGVAVFGEHSRRVFVESGACKPEQVWVTGAPRLDCWRDVDLENDDKNSVLLISYAHPRYEASENFEQVLNVFAEASKAPDGVGTRFVVKCKHESDRDYILENCLKVADHKLKFLTGPLTEHIPSARLIIGHESLAIIESLLSVVPVVIPFWGDAVLEDGDLLVNPKTELASRAFMIADSPQELKSFINMAVSAGAFSAVDQEARHDVMSQYFLYDRKESASAKVLEFVDHFLSRNAVAAPQPDLQRTAR